MESVLTLLDKDNLIEVECILALDLFCTQNHLFVCILVTKFFNCMCKKLVKKLSSSAVKVGVMAKAKKLSRKP